MSAIYARAASVYPALGWPGLLPLPAGKKTPPPPGYTGDAGRMPTAEDIERWKHRHGDGNAALRLSDGLIGIDVDHYDGKPGADTLGTLEKAWGALPATWISSARAMPSGVRFYRVPLGTRLNDKPGAGIEILQRHHRYAVVAPSRHPSGSQYRWYRPDGELAARPPRPEELPALPAAWVEGLTTTTRTVAHVNGTVRAKADRLARSHAVDRALSDALTDFYGGRHDAALVGAMALARLAERGHPGAEDALDDLGVSFRSQVTADGTRSEAAAQKEWDDMVAGARAKVATSPATTPVWEERPHPPRDAEPPVREAPGGYHDDDAGPAAGAVTETDDDGTHLPHEFWTARPELAHIRRAARARLVAPDAVFGAVLARVAAITPHTVELPAIVGSPLGLTFYAAIIGAPEAGKSAAVGVAGELVPAPERVIDGLPIGSGEGMVEVLFEWVEEHDDDGKPRKLKKQTRHAAIFRVDEGAVLGDLGGRRGSTLLATLRSAYTSGPLGNANASAETRRILPGATYVYGVILGIQPELAGPLLADADAGTPQRFVWVSATDPGAPDEVGEWPGALPWQPPGPGELAPLGVISAGWQRHRLEVAGSIEAEVRAERLAVMRGELERSPLDAHGTLARLKVAALLAILNGRCEVDVEDWHLAGIVAATGRRVRARVEGALAGVAQRKEAAAADRHARREIHVEVTREQRALLAAARAAAKAAARHAKSREHEGRGCVQRCLSRAMAGRDRALVSVEDVVAEAERLGWLTTDGEHWLPGESRPA